MNTYTDSQYSIQTIFPMNSSEVIKQKQAQFIQLNQQFLAYQQQTKLIIEELEAENTKLRHRTIELQRQLATLKQKKREQTGVLEKQTENLKRQNRILHQQNEQMQRQIVDLQNNGQSCQNQLRSANALLEQYESKVERTMEELACLRFQLEECKETNQEQIARLKSQIRDTEQELQAVTTKHQKHHDQSEMRMSQYSWSSLTPKNKKWKDCLNLTSNDLSMAANMKKKTMVESIQSKQNPGFEHTMELMNSLLIQIDKKCLKIKYNSKKDIY